MNIVNQGISKLKTINDSELASIPNKGKISRKMGSEAAANIEPNDT